MSLPMAKRITQETASVRFIFLTEMIEGAVNQVCKPDFQTAVKRKKIGSDWQNVTQRSNYYLLSETGESWTGNAMKSANIAPQNSSVYVCKRKRLTAVSVAHWQGLYRNREDHNSMLAGEIQNRLTAAALPLKSFKSWTSAKSASMNG